MRAAGVSQRFGGVRAVDDVGLEIRAGEILGVIGPNGAGKSTLLNILSGVQRPSDGSVSLDGAEIVGRSAAQISRLGLARTFQNVRLIPEMTVLENVMVAAHRTLESGPIAIVCRTRSLRSANARARARALEALDFVGLREASDRLATSLSYGDQRRVEIARALMPEPAVLLLDEPAAGMNPTETTALKRLIEEIRDAGTAIALVEHDMAFLMDLSDRVVVLDHGEKIAEGTPAEVRADARVIEAYLGVPA